ncbi:MAG: YetF domain-containing protein [Candidatus Solibacter sp.]
MPEWLASPKMWGDIFNIGAPVVEKILRPALVYVFLVLALRFFGKRELAQLNPFDLVVLLMLSNTVQNAIIGNDNSMTGGIVGALALLIINFLVVRFRFRHPRFDEALEGDPTTLIEHGSVKKEALAQEYITKTELMTVLHRQGFQHINEVDCCVLEPGGTFDVRGKTPGADERSHAEVMRAIRNLTEKVDALTKARGPG